MEEILLSECKQGNSKSLKTLYNLYAPKMFLTCLRYSKNKDDAEDLLQEGFIKVFSSLHLYRHEGSFEGWIRRIIINTIITYNKNKHSKVFFVTYEGLENISGNSFKTALDNLFEKDLRKGIEQLNSTYKSVFYMRATEGYTHDEIGKKLGISPNTSKSQYRRARIILQKTVKKINMV